MIKNTKTYHLFLIMSHVDHPIKRIHQCTQLVKDALMKKVRVKVNNFYEGVFDLILILNKKTKIIRWWRKD